MLAKAECFFVLSSACNNVFASKYVNGLQIFTGSAFCASANPCDFHFVNLNQLMTKSSFECKDISYEREGWGTTMVGRLVSLMLLSTLCEFIIVNNVKHEVL